MKSKIIRETIYWGDFFESGSNSPRICILIIRPKSFIKIINWVNKELGNSSTRQNRKFQTISQVILLTNLTGKNLCQWSNDWFSVGAVSKIILMLGVWIKNSTIVLLENRKVHAGYSSTVVVAYYNFDIKWMIGWWFIKSVSYIFKDSLLEVHLFSYGWSIEFCITLPYLT